MFEYRHAHKNKQMWWNYNSNYDEVLIGFFNVITGDCLPYRR